MLIAHTAGDLPIKPERSQFLRSARCITEAFLCSAGPLSHCPLCLSSTTAMCSVNQFSPFMHSVSSLLDASVWANSICCGNATGWRPPYHRTFLLLQLPPENGDDPTSGERRHRHLTDSFGQCLQISTLPVFTGLGSTVVCLKNPQILKIYTKFRSDISNP